MSVLLRVSIPCVGLILALQTGCSSRGTEDDAVFFDIAGPVAVDIESFGGDIAVIADPDATQASVEVQRWADMGDDREDESETSLAAISYTAAIESGAEGPVLQVRATTSHAEPHRQRANILVVLPAAENVRIVTAHCEVTVVDAQGSATIEAGDEVTYLTNWPITQPVSITTQEDGIVMRVRGESQGSIEAQTLDGAVSVTAKHGALQILHHDGRRLHAVLNGGENPIILRAAEGYVTVGVIEHPTESSLRANLREIDWNPFD